MTPFTSSTKEMNMIKATSLAFAAAMLISNAASASDSRYWNYPWCSVTQLPDHQYSWGAMPGARWESCIFSSREECTDRESRIIREHNEMNDGRTITCYKNSYYTESLVGQFGNWLRGTLDDWKQSREQSREDAEQRRLRKIAVECQASSATEAQASACYALRTGKY
jgi:hypothetical protein